jgi:hypothetical protein
MLSLPPAPIFHFVPRLRLYLLAAPIVIRPPHYGFFETGPHNSRMGGILDPFFPLFPFYFYSIKSPTSCEVGL